MKRRRRTPQEIIKKPREAGGVLAPGKDEQVVGCILAINAATCQALEESIWGCEKSDCGN
jgi:hypothetical protein